MKRVILITTVFALLIACDRRRVYEQFERIDKNVWQSSNILHFNVNIQDTVGAHNVYVAVRNTGQYEYSNLYLFITALAPNGVQTQDTTEIILADEHGKWQGKGSASVFTLYYPFRQNIRFPQSGIYQFDIEQAMWTKELTHISDIGLRIEKVKRKN